jgi:GAF domain-containing protein
VTETVSAGIASPDRSTLAAVGRVLALVGGSGFELQPVLDKIAEEAAQLCRADTGFVFLRDGDLFRFVAASGSTPEHWAHEREHPDTKGRRSIVGRVALSGAPERIDDVPADAEYEAGAYTVGGVRSLLGVPIRTDEGLIGAFGLGRMQVNPFTDDEVAVVSIFADQAAVAIRIARLLGETQEAVERESAVREVLQAISRAEFDLTGVLQAIIDTATRLTRADDGNIIREDAGSFGLAVFTAGVPASFREIIGSRKFGPERGSAMGRSLLELKPVQILDVLADPEYTLVEAQREIGFRTILAIPLLNEGVPIGVLSIWRGQVDPFSDAEIRLLTTFAEQAAVTMRLARVLDETREGYERESAVGQVLASIARSSFDLPSVLNAVTESAARLTHADSGNLAVIEGGEYRIAAAYGEKSAELKRMFEASRITLDRGSMAGRVTLERRTVQIPDVLADPEYHQLQMQEVVGFRTLLGVPLMRAGEPTGVLMMQRSEVRPFTDQEIALITTFADQAALAIANVELYETVERQRAALASFAPHVAGLLSTPGGEALLAGHRREISALFCDMRGFTAFAETAEPEELFSVLREYHAEVGRIALRNGGTVEHFAGDGFMIFFNDPTPVADHPLAATRAALAMHERFAQLAEGWHRRGYDLGLGIGVSVGYATLGRIGFEGRYDYAGVGAVTNMAARLSSAAAAGETLLSQRAYAAVEGRVDAEPTDELSLKGFSHAVVAYRVTGLRPDA